MDNAPNRKNWLERNPKKVRGALVLMVIAAAAHFNDRGSRLVAARIAAALTPIIDRLAKKPLSANQK